MVKTFFAIKLFLCKTDIHNYVPDRLASVGILRREKKKPGVGN